MKTHVSESNRTSGSGLQIHRGRTGQPFRPIVGGRLVLGSAPECDLRLGGAGMPSVHSLIHADGGRAWIESVAADPPLLVNGEPKDMTSLADGDMIMVGPFAFTWRTSEGVVEPTANVATGLSVADLVDRLERDIAMVVESDVVTRRAAATVVEAALETLYGGEANVPVVGADRDGLGAWRDELSRRIESQEKAHAEAVSSLLDTQERLVAQIESLVHRLLDEETGGEELRASA